MFTGDCDVGSTTEALINLATPDPVSLSYNASSNWYDSCADSADVTLTGILANDFPGAISDYQSALVSYRTLELNAGKAFADLQESLFEL
jgi:hypothetical protein